MPVTCPGRTGVCFPKSCSVKQQKLCPQVVPQVTLVHTLTVWSAWVPVLFISTFVCTNAFLASRSAHLWGGCREEEEDNTLSGWLSQRTLECPSLGFQQPPPGQHPQPTLGFLFLPPAGSRSCLSPKRTRSGLPHRLVWCQWICLATGVSGFLDQQEWRGV